MPSSPGSLRETYSPPPDSWSFIPEVPTSSSGTPAKSAWSRTSKPHVFDLSPAQFDELGGDFIDDLGSRDWGKRGSDFAASAILAYAGTAVVMPFEVAKVLLQVQWIPKEDLEDLMEPPEETQPAQTDREEDAVSITYIRFRSGTYTCTR